MTRWSEAETLLLMERYPHKKTADIAVDLSRSERQVYNKAAAMGLKKTQEYLASPDACRLRRGDNTGAAHRFVKGQEAWNKGIHYMPGGDCKKTQFKPGHRGGKALEKYKPIGSERVSKDGYLERKVNDGMPLQRRWRAVHLLLWEEANGPLPKGHALIFVNGDKSDIRLDNLQLLTRAELMKRNSCHRYPEEVARLIQLRGALNRQINQRRNPK